MTPTDSTNDENTMRSTMLHQQLNDQKTHQIKNLKLAYLPLYYKHLRNMDGRDLNLLRIEAIV